MVLSKIDVGLSHGSDPYQRMALGNLLYLVFVYVLHVLKKNNNNSSPDLT